MAPQEFTSATRIRELGDLSAMVPEMIQTAGQAVNVLSPNAQEDGEDIEARKQTYEQNQQAYYLLIQAWQARMKRQVYALEEAGIIAPATSTATTANSQQQSQQGGSVSRAATAQPAEPERITNGGLGNLDVGWLNSRVNKVGVEKEAELLSEAKALLQEEVNKRRAASDG